MLTYLFERKLRKKHSELTDRFAAAIYEMINDRENTFFCEYLDSFDAFIEFAAKAEKTNDNHSPIYANSKKYKNGRIISKDKIEIDIFSKYVSIGNSANRIYFSLYNMAPLKHTYQMTAFRNILCEKLTEKINGSVRSYDKYSSEELAKCDIRAHCRQLYNYTYENSKIPSLRLCLTAVDPYSEVLGNIKKW